MQLWKVTSYLHEAWELQFLYFSRRYAWSNGVTNCIDNDIVDIGGDVAVQTVASCVHAFANDVAAIGKILRNIGVDWRESKIGRKIIHFI